MEEQVAKLRALRDTADCLLPQIYHHNHSLPEGEQYRAVLTVVQAHQDAAAKLVRKFGSEHPRAINLDKADKNGADALRAAAPAIIESLAPLYGLLEEIAVFQEHTLRVMTDLAQSLLPFSLDYTPELLDAYMGLFTAACRVHIIAANMPRPLILQLYAFAFDHVNNADPPHFAELCSFVLHFQDAFPRLQVEFTPVSMRVGEVLEKIVTPAIRCLSDFKQLRGCDLFGFSSLDGPSGRRGMNSEMQRKGLAGMTREQTFDVIQRLQTLRDWAFLGIMVCPGETVRAEVRALLSIIARDNLRHPIYRNHVEWIHPLIEKFVVPTMVTVAKKQSHLSWGSKRDAKKIVERSFGEACEAAVGEHRMRRTWLMQHLSAAHLFFQEQPSSLWERLPMATALLALSRAEIEWALLHGGESLPRGLPMSWRSGFSSSQPLKAGFPDLNLAPFIAAHCDLLELVEQHRPALRAGIAWQLHWHLTDIVRPMFAQVSAAPTLTKHHQPVIQTLEHLLTKYDEVANDVVKARCSSDDGEAAAEAAANRSLRSVPAVRSIWYSLNAQLFSARTKVTGQSLDALISQDDLVLRKEQTSNDSPGNDMADLGVLGGSAAMGKGKGSLIKELNVLSDLAELLAHLDERLRAAASLRSLCFQVPKIKALFAAVNFGPGDTAHASLAFLPIVATFHENDVQKFNEDHGKVAEKVAEELMTETMSRLRSCLYDLYRLGFAPGARDAPAGSVVAQPPPAGLQHLGAASTSGVPPAALQGSAASDTSADRPLSVLQPSPSPPSASAAISSRASLRASMTRAVKGGKDLLSSISALDSGGNSAQTVLLAGNSWHRDAAAPVLSFILAVVRACSPSLNPTAGRCIAASPHKLFVPSEWLLEAVAQAFRTFVRQATWSGRIIQRPSHLEKQVSCFCSMLGVIQGYTEIDLGMTIREVLLGQTFAPLPDMTGDGLQASLSFSPTRLARHQPGGSVSKSGSAAQIVDWLVTYIVRDRGDAGIAYSVRQLTFFTRSSHNLQQQIKAAAVGPFIDASLYASASELRAVIRLYGPYFAVELGQKLESSLHECLLSLCGSLMSQEDVLRHLSAVDQPAREYQKAAQQAGDLRSIQQAFRQLGRALFMRQLVSAACEAELSSSVPYIPAAVRCAEAHAAWSAGKGAASHRWPSSRLLAALGLPPPDQCCGPGVQAGDPALVRYLTEATDAEFQRWRLFPLLGALMATTADWGMASWSPHWEALTHEQHCFPHVVHCIAVAMEQAANERLSAAPSGALEARDVTASSLLLSFCRTAAKLIFSEAEPLAAQVLLLDIVRCSHLRGGRDRQGTSQPPSSLTSACYRVAYGPARVQA